MNRALLEIYRDIYITSGGKNQVLTDLWDKFASALEDRGMPGEQAECIALQLVEWIRSTWGGLPLTERHAGDPRPVRIVESDEPQLLTVPTTGRDPLHGSRFALLRDHVAGVLVEAGTARPDEAALEIVEIVRRDYRGRYMPRIKRLDLLRRDLDIYRKGNTAADMERLAREHNISVVRVYQINKAVLQDKDRREQPLLPLWR